MAAEGKPAAYLTRLKRSSSTAATSFPSHTIAAEAFPWYALIPRIFTWLIVSCQECLCKCFGVRPVDPQAAPGACLRIARMTSSKDGAPAKHQAAITGAQMAHPRDDVGSKGSRGCPY